MKKKNYELTFIVACILLITSAFLNVYMAFLLQRIIDATSTNRTAAIIKPIIIPEETHFNNEDKVIG